MKNIYPAEQLIKAFWMYLSKGRVSKSETFWTDYFGVRQWWSLQKRLETFLTNLRLKKLQCLIPKATGVNLEPLNVPSL